MILVHNHPSGNPEPSKDDLLFTKRVWEAGATGGYSAAGSYCDRGSAVFQFSTGRVTLVTGRVLNSYCWDDMQNRRDMHLCLTTMYMELTWEVI